MTWLLGRPREPDGTGEQRSHVISKTSWESDIATQNSTRKESKKSPPPIEDREQIDDSPLQRRNQEDYKTTLEASVDI